MIDMPSLKSVTIGASSFHDGNALNMTGNGSDCLSWCRFTAFGIPSPWRLCFQYRKDSCVCELVMLRSVIQRLVKIAVSDVWCEVVPWLCQCGVWKLAFASECHTKTYIDYSQRRLVNSRSVIVSMWFLRVHSLPMCKEQIFLKWNPLKWVGMPFGLKEIMTVLHWLCEVCVVLCSEE